MLDLSHQHIASATKDRTGLLDGQYFKPSVETGQKLLEWLEQGIDPDKQRLDLLETARQKWNECAGKDDDEGFRQWIEKRKKTEETITIAELQSLINALDERLTKKASEIA